MTDRPHKNSMWSLRKVGGAYVTTTADDGILIAIPINRGDDKWLNHNHMTRADARLLAKRITQCLDATRKR